jgi:hypothetical protein
MTAESTVLATLLAAGHCLGDFVFQSDGMIRRKDRVAGLVAHGAVVALCHWGMLLPFWGAPVALSVLAIAVTHSLVDLAKLRAARRWPSLAREWFLLDQALHGAVLVLVWAQLTETARIVEGLPFPPDLLATIGILVSAYAFNVGGMSAVVVGELARLRIRPEGALAAGRVIGVLERLFALTLILLDRWEALGFLLAAKSLARFKELDRQDRAEYYLVGTLVSLLGVSATALVVRGLLSRI